MCQKWTNTGDTILTKEDTVPASKSFSPVAVTAQETDKHYTF